MTLHPPSPQFRLQISPQFKPQPAPLLLAATLLLAACATTSAALDGVGGVFIGAGEDVRSLNRR
ncbi:MAG: hypothetical protein ACXIU7_03450 [Roseinatronobacter sp.]